jgi:uncharacterized protein (DUF486 family)
MRGTSTIVLMFLSTAFITVAWYGHLLSDDTLARPGLFSATLVSRGIAFFEHGLQMPADRLGHLANGIGAVFSR